MDTIKTAPGRRRDESTQTEDLLNAAADRTRQQTYPVLDLNLFPFTAPQTSYRDRPRPHCALTSIGTPGIPIANSGR